MKLKLRNILCILAAATLLLTVCGCKKKVAESSSAAPAPTIEAPTADDKQDPENTDITEEKGAKADTESLTVKEGRANGIDVSKWQGKIDWSRVKKSGIDFAIIRIGLRGENGTIYKDSAADYNLQQAEKAGVLCGVYFFSTALSEKEAEAEADFTAAAVAGYSVSYPVVYDCEGFREPDSRMYGVTNTQRTNNALAFLNRIKAKGYEGMLYSSVKELSGSAYWDTARLENAFSVWVARYPAEPYPKTAHPDYSGKYDMWQYTDNGTVAGIEGNVDMSVAYFTRQKAEPKNKSARPGTAAAPSREDGVYTAVSDKVTPKIEVNLRTAATTKSDVAANIKNGTVLNRTGIGSNGWSKINYNGKTVYAITSYLTADLSAKAPETRPDDGFTAASGKVTAKDETNLRAEPSTDGKLIATIKNGEFVEKTGESPKGWTRLLYNGQTVYAKTSLLTTEVKKPAASSETPSAADEFVAAAGRVTAKDIVNLRSSPNGKEDNIVCQLKNGEFAERLATNGGKGWTRLSYNGQTLYAVSSMLITAEEYNRSQNSAAED